MFLPHLGFQLPSSFFNQMVVPEDLNKTNGPSPHYPLLGI
ncbi:hypothetical protein SLEP1_g19020 [Rubroshorea leprosula]|nr:hypothetical protein SLEP1_g19020 [Rubroshorea leprosula]